MSNIIDRISLLAENENVKITALERKIGASKGVLSRALANKTDIQSKWVTIIVENYPKYSAEWLITGKEPMLKEKQTAPVADTKYFDEYVVLLKKNNELHEENKELLAELHQLKNLLGLNEGSIIKSPNLHGVTDTDNTGLVAPKKELKKQ